MGPSKASPAPIQVVFQGGGAKLCVLMAVAEIMQNYQINQRIQIKRVAGSSAGAIAATMLASGKPIGTYKAELSLLAAKYLKKTQIHRWLGTYRVFTGSAYFKELYLENFFKELFCSKADDPKSIKDLLLKDTRIYYTDLYSLESKAAPATEAIPKALAISCRRFPFAFVGFGSGNTEVDGGLGANLPVKELKDDASIMGQVIGISFTNTFGNMAKSNIISYTQQLFSAAIQSGVARSVLELGAENVYPIDTGIGTFDFDRALGEGLSKEYDRIKGTFDTWLDTWLRQFGPIEPVRAQKVYKLLRPSLSDAVWYPAIVREINDRLRKEPSTNAKSVGCYETALLDDEGEFTGKYLAKTVKIFHVIRPTNILQFDFEIGRGASFAAANLGCAGFDSRGNPLALVPHVEELTEPNDVLRSFRVYFVFDHPITPESGNQPYRVEYQYEGDNPYPNLGKKPDAAALTLRQGGADEAILCVAFPRAMLGPMDPIVTDIATASKQQLKAAQLEVDDDEVLTPSEPLRLLDFVDSMALQQAPERYVLIGRRRRNIEQGGSFGFVIEKA